MKKSKDERLPIDQRIRRLHRLVGEHGAISTTQVDGLEQADRFIIEILLRFKPRKHAEKTIEILRSKSTKRQKKFRITRPSKRTKASKPNKKGKREK